MPVDAPELCGSRGERRNDGVAAEPISLCDERQGRTVCYDISPEVLDEFLKLVERTEDKELGFQSCWDGEKEVRGRLCVGSDCLLELTDCSGLPEVANYHTHPPEGDEPDDIEACTASTPSAGDLVVHTLRGCVAGPRGTHMTCWQAKGEPGDIVASLLQEFPDMIRWLAARFSRDCGLRARRGLLDLYRQAGIEYGKWRDFVEASYEIISVPLAEAKRKLEERRYAERHPGTGGGG